MHFNLSATLFAALCCYAMASDVVGMKISNRTTGSLVLLYVFVAVLQKTGLPVILEHFAWALLVLIVTFGLFLRGRFGGGDAKLMAATTLWIGGGQPLLRYLVLVGVFGGVLAMLILCVRAFLRVYPVPLPLPKWLHQEDAGIPYGVAIGLAGMMIVSDLLTKPVQL